MGELMIGAGDSLSRLLQVFAKEAGLKRIWTGDGKTDLRNIVFELFNTIVARDQLWKGVGELYSMSEFKDFPENVQAKLMAIILARRALIEANSKVPTSPQVQNAPQSQG